MDRDNKSAGRGRGSFLLEMMKAQQKRAQTQVPSHSLETPDTSTEPTTSFERHSDSFQSRSSFTDSNVSQGHGRAQLLNTTLMKSRCSNVAQSRSSPSVASSGRGSLPSSLMTNIRYGTYSLRGNLLRRKSCIVHADPHHAPVLIVVVDPQFWCVGYSGTLRGEERCIHRRKF